MESTRDLAYYAKHALRREVRAYKAVANDYLCLVNERRLTNVEDQNDCLIKLVDDLNEENVTLRCQLTIAERDNTRLKVENAELRFKCDTFRSRHESFRIASLKIKEASDELLAVAATTVESKLASVTKHAVQVERAGNRMSL